jgi:FdhD protein
MGVDKRGVLIDGVPLLVRAVEALWAVTDELLVVTAGPDDEVTVRGLLATGRARERPVTWLHDHRRDHGPVAGIEAALAGATHDVVIVVAGDHPAVVPGVLARLTATLRHTSRAEVCALVTSAGPQPLVAAYRPAAVLPVVRALLDRGERRASELLRHLEVCGLTLEETRALDPAGLTALDVDTPGDLTRLRGVLALAGGPTRPADQTQPSLPIARTRQVHRISSVGRVTRRSHDTVVVEEPLEIRAAGPGQPATTLVTTLRTPGHDAELAAGWLFAEGLVTPEDTLTFEIGDPLELARPDDQLTVRIARPVDLTSVAHRHAAATASCGVCGRAAIDELAARCTPVPPSALAAPVPFTTLGGLPSRVRAAQPVFAATGGLHAAALATLNGDLVAVREDVGRHNALDAVIGSRVLVRAVPLHGHLGVLSGRVGFELVAKAATAGLPVLAAVGAPTDLAIRTAERLGVTLVGFLREDGGNIYTHPHRIDLER